jgi:hypothetical protein
MPGKRSQFDITIEPVKKCSQSGIEHLSISIPEALSSKREPSGIDGG